MYILYSYIYRERERCFYTLSLYIIIFVTFIETLDKLLKM